MRWLLFLFLFTLPLSANQPCWQLKYEALCRKAIELDRDADYLELRSLAMVRRNRALARYYRCRAYRLYCFHCQHEYCALNSPPP